MFGLIFFVNLFCVVCGIYGRHGFVGALFASRQLGYIWIPCTGTKNQQWGKALGVDWSQYCMKSCSLPRDCLTKYFVGSLSHLAVFWRCCCSQVHKNHMERRSASLWRPCGRVLIKNEELGWLHAKFSHLWLIVCWWIDLHSSRVSWCDQVSSSMPLPLSCWLAACT